MHVMISIGALLPVIPYICLMRYTPGVGHRVRSRGPCELDIIVYKYIQGIDLFYYL